MQKTNIELLKERIEQNYADFREDTLLLDGEDIYDMADRIAAVEDTYYQLMTYDYVDEDDAEYLLIFHNPLEMIADCLEELRDDEPVDIDEALFVLFDRDDGENEDNYITAELAEELKQKHGADISVKLALLMETIEAGERYVRLLKLDKDEGVDFCSDEE